MRNIPCNVMAGFHDDHVLVPIDRIDEAIDAVEVIRAQRDVEDGA